LAVVGFTVALALAHARGATAGEDVGLAAVESAAAPPPVPTPTAAEPTARLPLAAGERPPPPGPERVALFRQLALLDPDTLGEDDRARRAELLAALGEVALDRRLPPLPARDDPPRRWVAFVGPTTLVTYLERGGREVLGLDVTAPGE